MIIGSHVGMTGPSFFEGSVKEALSYGSTAFMFYTGAPQNSIRKPLDELKIEEGLKLMNINNISTKNIIVHAPYIVNLANSLKPELLEASRKLIISELKRTKAFCSDVLVLHPGSHVGQGNKEGIDTLIKSLDMIFKEDGTDVKIALETMAGKGSEIGITFEQLKEIINRCKYPNRLGVCLDTCHINDAGYDVNDVDDILKSFDSIIGLDKLLVIHLNDSKNPQNAHKDRHENIGYGFIGFDTLNTFAHHPLLQNIPKILETPYINGAAPYKKEIEMLRSGVYINNWKELL